MLLIFFFLSAVQYYSSLICLRHNHRYQYVCLCIIYLLYFRYSLLFYILLKQQAVHLLCRLLSTEMCPVPVVVTLVHSARIVANQAMDSLEVQQRGLVHSRETTQFGQARNLHAFVSIIFETFKN